MGCGDYKLDVAMQYEGTDCFRSDRLAVNSIIIVGPRLTWFSCACVESHWFSIDVFHSRDEALCCCQSIGTYICRDFVVRALLNIRSEFVCVPRTLVMVMMNEPLLYCKAT